ncbi:MAG: protoheme IX farnesyltransferase [Geobacter sp.]|nr:protoheme IX farnesyltransferase [Geobacter sp.]
MIRELSSLFRLRLAILNGVAAIGGAVFFPAPAGTVLVLAVFAAVVLLAAGGSALNQVLEHDLDRLMFRTRLRPIPRGFLTPATAAIIGLSVSAAGLVLLFAAAGTAPTLLGAAALAWYLAIYTPLKRRTPYALAAGAVCGALPPLIGWCSAGGSMADYRIMLLAGLLYLWQIPHFWLFQRRHAADYRAAGFPLLAVATRSSALPPLFWLWLASLATATTLLPTFGLISRSGAILYLLFPLPLIAMSLFRSEKILFSYLNAFPLMITVVIIAQKI